ncbi:MAG TPA: MBL fold metallo-hydrolase [Ktedonobacterales bacterium]|nr:MBL fold metallo-hydrolase [Ktedonobacterales bacterium]
MELSFHGAAGGVTGSCHLLQANGKQILVDCGLFQGSRDLDEENGNHFGFDAREIDILLLTHAHLDHCGRIPLLMKRGFRGEIITTSATRELAKLVLMDSANLQVEEARRKGRRHQRRGDQPPEPLYDVPDVLDAMERFGRTVRYDKPIDLGHGIRATFGNAGHILGSAWVLLEVEEQGERKALLFSGDMGNREKPILNPPTPAPRADYVVMESTYGNRAHKSLADSVEELKEAILDTLERGGNIIIPTFALERAQDLLYFLRELEEQRELPRYLSVFLDSPMAISATEIFRRHPEYFNPETLHLFQDGKDPFTVPGLHFTRDTNESKSINHLRGGAVIMAGSGMATGGRVLHHLQNNLWRKESSVVFVGYASEGTLARRIIDGEKEVRIFGEDVRVAAKVYTIGGFSAHADQQELLDWYHGSGTPAITFLVHGEETGRATLAQALRGQGLRVEAPAMHDRYTL